ncbi:MAG: hypothetical protein QMD85_00105 [Candidatus Aenigmarchaeota archaeon]|nr:hypothetical protein [Candidatus Aenigmarchaeota archaeon]MDI6721931.1 hypothetical protein [Candidatus Aenigmarchaeota archaeon]
MEEKKDVRLLKLAKGLEGLNTALTISRKLGVKKKTAINYIYELRKKGLVKTTHGKGNIRVYDISAFKKTEMGYPGLYDIISEHSPMKIAKPFEHRIYEKMGIEEAIIRALETKDFRTILASIALFRHVRNWPKLYYYAKKSGARRRVGALYDLSRQIMRVRKMDRRIERRLLEAKEEDMFMVTGIRTRDFLAIEKKWRVYVPFTKGDLRRLKE